MQISQEYVGALAILLVSVLRAFGIEIGSDVVSSLIVAVVAVWVAIKRRQRGDLAPGIAGLLGRKA
jgi:hypothetical protein